MDPDGVTDRLELGVALDRASEIELDVEGHEIEPVERAMAAHGHDVVAAEDADASPGGVPCPRCDQLARAVVEDLLELGCPVLTDVPRLGREDDVRLPVRRYDYIGVAVNDLEPRHVRDGPLEARVLVPGDDKRIEVVRRHRGTDVPVPALQLGAQSFHESSSPLINEVMASFRGV